MITWATIIPALISAALTILIMLLTLSFRFGKMYNKIENTENRLKRIESTYDNFMATLISKMPGGNAGDRVNLDPLLERFDKLLSNISPKGNPITGDDINKLKQFRNKIAQGSQFTLHEYREFENLSKKIEKELPENTRNEYNWVIAGLLGVALGLLIAAVISKK